MSGDVQPRKRKDKRRKKDDDDAGTPPPNLVNPLSEHVSDNLTIHVHKEGGTGGHWCARIIFFVLFSILVGLVGVIIFEHRGSTDVDTPVASSRWAVIFDGWVDDVLPQHGDEPHDEENASSEGDEHEEETEEEEDEHGEHDEEDEETEEDHGSEEVADKESAEGEQYEDEGIGEEGDEEEGDEEDDEEADGTEGDEGEDDQQASAEEEIVVRRNAYKDSKGVAEDEDDDDDKLDEGYEEQDFEEDNEDDALDEVDDDTEEDNDEAHSEEDEAEEEEKEADEDEQEEAKNVSENDLDVSIEGVTGASEEKDEDDGSQEFFSIPGVGEIDNDSAEPLEEIEDGELEEVVNDLEIEPEEEEIEEESSSVAVKFGVGVALIVAAHFVLVRRWNNVEAELAGSYSDEVLDLSRRNTIVPPVSPKNLVASTEAGPEVVRDEKVVESYEELRVKYKGLEVDSPELPGVKKNLGRVEGPLVKNTPALQQAVPEDKRALLKSEATGSERETEEELQTSESERQSATEPEEEVSEEEEEEEEEDEEEDEEDDEEVEDVDDSELVAKLEAKYGKLPTPTESEEEDEDYDDEEEEEDEEEEPEEDEEIQGWKRVRAPKGPHSEPESEQRHQQQHHQEAKKKEAPKGRQGTSSSTGGPRVHDYANNSSVDEVSIQEEISSWLSKELDN